MPPAPQRIKNLSSNNAPRRRRHHAPMSSEVSGPLQLTHLPFRNCGQAILFFFLSQCTYYNCAPQFFLESACKEEKEGKGGSASLHLPPTDRCIHLGRSPAAALLRAPSLLFSQNNGTSPPPCSRLQKVWLCAGGKGGGVMHAKIPCCS